MEQVFWLSGSSHLRKLALDKIKSQFVDGEMFYFNKDTSYGLFEETVYQDSCFASKRLIIVDDFPVSASTRQTVVNNIKKIIDDIPANCHIVFNNLDGEGVKPLTTHIGKHGKVLEYDTILQKENAPFWVIKEITTLEKKIDEDTAKFFVDLNGFDPENKGIGLDVLKIAIDKIVQYVGRRKNIEKQDVIINSFPSSEFIIWSIFAAMDSKDLVKCSTAFRGLLDGSDNAMGAVIQFLNIALWRYRLLAFAKESLAKTNNKNETMKLSASLIKIKTEGSGMATLTNSEKDLNNKEKQAYPDFTINKEINGNYGQNAAIDKYTRKDLIRIIQCIYQCLDEIRLRSNDAAILLLADILMYSVCDSVPEDKLFKICKSME